MFLSFVVTILNHLNILPSFISALGRALLSVLGTESEVVAFNSAASIFLGQVFTFDFIAMQLSFSYLCDMKFQIESPMLIKDYLPKLTRSEMFTIMVGGLSTIAGERFRMG
jgi:concentrative nucleoside transporter, CNT family